MKQKKKIDLYTDGSYRPSGVGAWASVQIEKNKALILSGSVGSAVSNEEMELMAVVASIKKLIHDFLQERIGLRLYTDYQQICDVLNRIISPDKQTQNKELWSQLLFLQELLPTMQVTKVESHADEINRVCDRLAKREAVKKEKEYLDKIEVFFNQQYINQYSVQMQLVETHRHVALQKHARNSPFLYRVINYFFTILHHYLKKNEKLLQVILFDPPEWANKVIYEQRFEDPKISISRELKKAIQDHQIAIVRH